MWRTDSSTILKFSFACLSLTATHALPPGANVTPDACPACEELKKSARY